MASAIWVSSFQIFAQGAAYHSLNHFWEIGQTTAGNAPQTDAVITKVADEILVWAEEMV